MVAVNFLLIGVALALFVAGVGLRIGNKRGRTAFVGGVIAAVGLVVAATTYSI